MNSEPNCNLLHNMSAPPKTVVKYAGLHSLRAADIQQSNANYFGTPVRFELANALGGKDDCEILSLVGVKPGTLNGTDPGERLIALIEACALKLPLPEGCAVIPTKTTHQVLWADVLTTLAILTKSTTTVWLRSKTPSISSIANRTAVSLLVPPGFTNQLPEATR